MTDQKGRVQPALMTTETTEPRTEAGRSYLSRWPRDEALRSTIRAIEAEAESYWKALYETALAAVERLEAERAAAARIALEGVAEQVRGLRGFSTKQASVGLTGREVLVDRDRVLALFSSTEGSGK